MKIRLKDGTEFDLAPFIDGFKARHPHVQDMSAELAKMHLWLARNPSRQPVSPYRFVDNWMKKIKPKPAKLHIVGSSMSEPEMLAAGQRIGISPAPGESWAQFGRRLKQKLA